MIRPDFKGFKMAFKIVTEGFKGADNGKEFFIVDIIVLFWWLQGFWVVHDGVPPVEKVWLF
jgi:hypothetical protein